jgi:hypothetical protein
VSKKLSVWKTGNRRLGAIIAHNRNYVGNTSLTARKRLTKEYFFDIFWLKFSKTPAIAILFFLEYL